MADYKIKFNDEPDITIEPQVMGTLQTLTNLAKKEKTDIYAVGINEESVDTHSMSFNCFGIMMIPQSDAITKTIEVSDVTSFIDGNVVMDENGDEVSMSEFVCMDTVFICNNSTLTTLDSKMLKNVKTISEYISSRLRLCVIVMNSKYEIATYVVDAESGDVYSGLECEVIYPQETISLEDAKSMIYTNKNSITYNWQDNRNRNTQHTTVVTKKPDPTDLTTKNPKLDEVV